MAEPEYVTRDQYRSDLAGIEREFTLLRQDVSLLRNDVSWLKWVMAIGFGLLAALSMAMLGALWQIMQRLPSTGG
jgi:hypothetical protein